MRHTSIFTTSWVVLLLLATAITIFSLISASRALRRVPDTIVSGYSIEQVQAVNADAADALRGRRLTASAFSLGFALFLAFVILVPYRRGEQWAWWAILVSLGSVIVVSLLRVPIMGVTGGSTAYGLGLVLLAIALTAGAPRVFRRQD